MSYIMLQQPSSAMRSPSSTSKRNPVVARVKDSWDDSSSSEDEQRPPPPAALRPVAPKPVSASPTTNSEIWNAANASQPMPEIVSTSTPVPAAAALSGPMRILKRPTAPSPSPLSSDRGTASPKPLADREAEYNAARERIFGGTQQQAQTKPQESRRASGSPAGDRPQPRQQQISRQPRGPDSAATASTRMRRPDPNAPPAVSVTTQQQQ